jgi:hypothetical protein
MQPGPLVRTEITNTPSFPHSKRPTVGTPFGRAAWIGTLFFRVHLTGNDTLDTLLKSVYGLRINSGFLYKALQLLLRNSYITAQGKTYRQTKGIATGTQTAPALANLYLHEKIKDILEDPDIFWSKRYIDDGICYVEKTAVERIRSRIEAIEDAAAGERGVKIQRACCCLDLIDL